MAVFYFAMFNALFVLIVFMLTLNKDVLHIDWPFGIKENITITEANEIIGTKKEDVLSDEALIEKNAVEIVKQMQRLKGIDGDYDSDSAASNRLAQRHTIQNLERNRQKKRAIGTLDVAFKKRFFALSGEEDAPGGQADGTPKPPINHTPILG